MLHARSSLPPNRTQYVITIPFTGYYRLVLLANTVVVSILQSHMHKRRTVSDVTKHLMLHHHHYHPNNMNIACNAIVKVAELSGIEYNTKYCSYDIILNGIIVVLVCLVFFKYLSSYQIIVELWSLVPFLAMFYHCSFFYWQHKEEPAAPEHLMQWIMVLVAMKLADQRKWSQQLLAVLSIAAFIVYVPMWYTRDISIIYHTLQKSPIRLEL
jgi:hypothetical protein